MFLQVGNRERSRTRQRKRKRRAAEAAVRYIESGMVLGVGTGSTVNQLIEVRKERKIQLSGAVSSSRQTSEKIRAAGIENWI